MKYLCLVYSNEARWPLLLHDECEALRQSGYLVAIERFPSSSNAATLRLEHGNLSLTDGPAIESNLQVAGYCMIEARDLNDAIRVVTNISTSHKITIEIRHTI